MLITGQQNPESVERNHNFQFWERSYINGQPDSWDEVNYMGTSHKNRPRGCLPVADPCFPGGLMSRGFLAVQQNAAYCSQCGHGYQK